MRTAITSIVIFLALLTGPLYAASVGMEAHAHAGHGMPSAMPTCGVSSCDAGASTDGASAAACISHCISAAGGSVIPNSMNASVASLLLIILAAVIAVRFGDDKAGRSFGGAPDGLSKLLTRQRLETVVLRN